MYILKNIIFYEQKLTIIKSLVNKAKKNNLLYKIINKQLFIVLTLRCKQ